MSKHGSMKKSNEHSSTRNPSWLISSITCHSDRPEIGRLKHLLFSFSLLLFPFSFLLPFSSPTALPLVSRARARFHFQDDSICSRFRVTYRGSKLNAILDEASDERWVVSWTMERSSSMVLHQTGSVLSPFLSLSLSLVRRRFSEKFLINHRGGRLLRKEGDLWIRVRSERRKEKARRTAVPRRMYRSCEFPLNLTLSGGESVASRAWPEEYKLKRNSRGLCHIKEWE